MDTKAQRKIQQNLKYAMRDLWELQEILSDAASLPPELERFYATGKLLDTITALSQSLSLIKSQG